WFPPLPVLSAFAETNVRTYVHRRGEGPGVWFFSLDAACSPAVRVARWRWRLNYFRAAMSVVRAGNRITYESRRLWPGTPGAGTSIEAEIGPPIPAAERAEEGRAAPGTLAHFLIERYILYAGTPGGRLFRGQVHHPRYPLREVRLERMHETLVASNGISPVAEPEHAIFSDGVNVEVFPLRALETI
ncbi:MAG: DUF2071 domain-containing protein, partial [Planctomycetes bacterium]|nr:DUF2071 domain-containing protein [Planctomycetota bacterium]